MNLLSAAPINLINSIKSFGKITESVSKKVRKQYEEHPYPRWKHTNKNLPSNFLNTLNNEIEPNKLENDNNNSEAQLEITASESKESFDRVVQSIDSSSLIEDADSLDGSDLDSNFSLLAESKDTVEELAMEDDQKEIKFAVNSVEIRS